MAGQDSAPLSVVEVLTVEGATNPYPIYQRIRSTEPVLWDSGLQSWVLTQYSDVAAASRDPRLSAVRTGTDVSWIADEYRDALGPVLISLSRQMLFLDPPDHTRIRGLVHKAFTPRTIETMRLRIQGLVDELLDEAAERGAMDVMHDLAVPLPAIVIAEMLGVPPHDRAQFQRWSEDFGALLGGSELTVEQITSHLAGVRDLMEYFRTVVERHRIEPQDDLLQAMIEAEQETDRLSEEELFANAVLLLAAGHLTTTGLIGNGVLTLIQHPDARQLLRREPSRIKGAVEEILRFESPIQLTGRRVIEDVQIGGKRLEVGQEVLLHLGAANRDPLIFEEPDTFDVTRTDNRHMAFSQGIHFCLGASLARLEGQIAIGTFFDRFPDARLDGDAPQWETDLLSRGMSSLNVMLTPR